MENEIIRFTTRISVPVELQSQCLQHSIRAHRWVNVMWAVCVFLLFSMNLVAGFLNLNRESNSVSTYLTNTEYYE